MGIVLGIGMAVLMITVAGGMINSSGGVGMIHNMAPWIIGLALDMNVAAVGIINAALGINVAAVGIINAAWK